MREQRAATMRQLVRLLVRQLVRRRHGNRCGNRNHVWCGHWCGDECHVRCNVSYDSSCNNYATTVTVNDATSSTTTDAATFCSTSNSTFRTTIQYIQSTSTTLLSSPMLIRRRQRCECLRCSAWLLLYAPVDHTGSNLCFSNSLLYVVFTFAITRNKAAQIRKRLDLLDLLPIDKNRALRWDFCLGNHHTEGFLNIHL